MGEYFDSAYTVADGVILFYEDDDVSLQIPNRLGDMDIHTIGDGAFMESKTIEYVGIPYGVKTIGQNAFKGCRLLKCISIPATVQEIGENAFAECPYLKNLRIFSYEVDEKKYIDLKASYRCANGSVYIASAMPDEKIIKAAVSSANVGPANLIMDRISRLFTAKDANDQDVMALYNNKHSCYCFGNRSSFISEIDSIKEMIGNNEPGETEALSESRNDQFLKGESFPVIKKTAILTFDDTKTRYENGKYYLLLEIMIGYHFWQSIVPVTFDGKSYYVYRRHFLSSTTNLNYIRKEITVLYDNGERAVLEEAKKVNAKYRLLSIL